MAVTTARLAIATITVDAMMEARKRALEAISSPISVMEAAAVSADAATECEERSKRRSCLFDPVSPIILRQTF